MPEKDDMSCPIGAPASAASTRNTERIKVDQQPDQQTTFDAQAVERLLARADWDQAFADVVANREPQQVASVSAEADERLRCVSSGYLDHGCSCEASVPRGPVTTAWRRELALGKARREDGFFRFAWMGAIWLAYGLRSGAVRGVYCPAHSAERDERASASQPTCREVA